MAQKLTKEKPPKGKYDLRTIHEEIGLYDRKLAHLNKYETFASDSERDLAAQKLNSKRNLLVTESRALINAGIEYNLSEIPRSLRAAEQPQENIPSDTTAAESETIAALPADVVELSEKTLSPSLQQEIQAYIKKRKQSHSEPVAS